MADKKDKRQDDSQEAEVWNAISAFEQILEAIPNDRTSIETLAHAYEQIGDLTRARDYAIRLADVVVAEGDQEGARNVMPKLEAHAAIDPAATKALQNLKAFLAEAAPAKSGTTPPPQQQSATKPATGSTPLKPASAASTERGSFNIANELPFAWNLLKANELTQEEYSNVVQDLTDMSASDASVTVSVLHVLHDRGYKNLSSVMTTAAKDCGTPIIALSNFELQSSAFSLLPPDYMIKRGVILFDFFGNDALVVIMNPYDKQLMKDVEAISGRKCYFYMTAPADFDAAINKISGWYEQQAHEEPKGA